MKDTDSVQPASCSSKMQQGCRLCSALGDGTVEYDLVSRDLLHIDESYSGESSTQVCAYCGKCLLCLETSMRFIPLRHYHATRGHLLQAAYALDYSMFLGNPLSPASIANFGVVSDQHYAALQTVLADRNRISPTFLTESWETGRQSLDSLSIFHPSPIRELCLKRPTTRFQSQMTARDCTYQKEFSLQVTCMFAECLSPNVRTPKVIE